VGKKTPGGQSLCGDYSAHRKKTLHGRMVLECAVYACICEDILQFLSDSIRTMRQSSGLNKRNL
jgi:hypothetical protein